MRKEFYQNVVNTETMNFQFRYIIFTLPFIELLDKFEYKILVQFI